MEKPVEIAFHESDKSFLVLEPSDPRWAKYILTKPQANLFHHPSWIRVISESYNYRSFVVAEIDSSGKLVGGLPLMEIDSILTGKRWVSLPFTDHCEPLVDDQASTTNLLQVLEKISSDQNISKIEIRWGLPDNSRIHPISDQVLHKLKLDPDPQVVFDRFRRQCRRSTIKAKQMGVSITAGNKIDYVKEFYKLHLQVRRSKGVPIQPWKFFEILCNEIIEKDLGFVLLANIDGKCIAAQLMLHWNNTLIAKYSASCFFNRKFKPNNLLMWEAIRWGCENGYHTLDMGKSANDNSGLINYKRGYRGDETPLVYSQMGGKQSFQGDGKLREIVESVIRKSPPWVCKLAGELLYRHFG
jgi:hypothetical protein